MILKTFLSILIAVGIAEFASVPSPSSCASGGVYTTPQAFNINVNSNSPNMCYTYTVGNSAAFVNNPLTVVLSQIVCNGNQDIIALDPNGNILYDVCNAQSQGMTTHTITYSGIYMIIMIELSTPQQLSTCFQFNSASSCSSTNTPGTTAAPTTVAPTTAGSTATASSSSTYGACGIPYYTPSTTGLRIVGGYPAVPYSFPWQALIITNLGNGYETLCGGSLINNQWIVTAAHCLEESGQTTAYLGVYYEQNANQGTVIPITTKIQNPQFNPNTIMNDIALLKLSTPVTFSNTIQPICLPNSNLVVPGARAGIATGWGDTSYDGTISNPLMQVTLPIQTFSYCGVGTNSTTQFCAGVQGLGSQVKDTCQGDSGGPFMLTDQGHFVLTGIVSFGGPCDGTGIYTNVYDYVPWILSTIASN